MDPFSFDPHLQVILNEELSKGIKNTGAKGAWALMIDPDTGEILAYHQSSYQNRKLLFEGKEPASTFKPISLSVCLKANEMLIKDGQEPIFSPENWRVAGNKTLNMNAALQRSSNAYFQDIVHKTIQKMGPTWYRKHLIDNFGLLKKNHPEEDRGFLPEPGKFYPNGKEEWHDKGTPKNLAIGYQVLATSLQMARSYAIIANKGLSFDPTKTPLLSPSICNTVTQAMSFVVKEGGTSKLADIPGYTTAGKSGTVRKFINGSYSTKHHIASFIGFSPIVSPVFVLLVSVDEPKITISPEYGPMHLGGTAAGPIFREIGKRALKHFNIKEDLLPDGKNHLNQMDLVRALNNRYTLFNSAI